MCITSVWNSTSNLLTGATSSAGSTPTFVSSPGDVTYDVYQNMYVADSGNHRIQQYQPGTEQTLVIKN